MDATRRRWERHWSSALSNEEIEWLAYTAGITSVRLPVGYFTLGAQFTKGTPFEGDIANVYVNAWEAVIRLCERLYAVGIGVLLDFHALPGGANDQDHGGTSSGKAELWGNRGCLELAKRAVVFMAGEVKRERVRGCLGIQMCNEACWGALGIWEWYEGVVRAVGEVDVSLPLYVSDGWDLGKGMEWCGRVNREGTGCPVGVAVPKYFCFTETDKKESPNQIIQRVGGEMGDVLMGSGNVVEKGAVQVMVVEWSCVMSAETWGKVREEDRSGLVRRFGRAQSEQWRKRAGGAYFWTAKMDWMDGGEWGLFEMVKKGALVAPANLMLDFHQVKEKMERARLLKDGKKKVAVDNHVRYWDSVAPKGHSEHWRFEQGWDLGYADASVFYEMRASGAVEGAKLGADTIGVLELWILKRLRESGQRSAFVWEWEHGFRQGVSVFEHAVEDSS